MICRRNTRLISAFACRIARCRCTQSAKSAGEAAGGGCWCNSTHLHAGPRCKRVLQLQLLPHVADGSRGQQLQGVVLCGVTLRMRGGSCSSESSPLAEAS
jgi:hypothetical protein